MTIALTRRDWWMGITIVVAAIVFHAVWPRHDWRHVTGNVFVRIDRWTGRASLTRVVADRPMTQAPAAASTPHIETFAPLEKP